MVTIYFYMMQKESDENERWVCLNAINESGDSVRMSRHRSAETALSEFEILLDDPYFEKDGLSVELSTPAKNTMLGFKDIQLPEHELRFLSSNLMLKSLFLGQKKLLRTEQAVEVLDLPVNSTEDEIRDALWRSDTLLQ